MTLTPLTLTQAVTVAIIPAARPSCRELPSNDMSKRLWHIDGASDVGAEQAKSPCANSVEHTSALLNEESSRAKAKITEGVPKATVRNVAPSPLALATMKFSLHVENAQSLGPVGNSRRDHLRANLADDPPLLLCGKRGKST